jgi:hypothetical protein
MTDIEVTFSSVSIPSGASCTLTVYENSGGGSSSVTLADGSSFNYDNSDSTSLSQAQSTYTLSGFDGAGNDFVAVIEPDTTDIEVTAEIDESIEIAVASTTVSGTVILGGSGVQGAILTVINDSDGTVEATTTTDSNGDYSVSVPQNEVYHVLVEYDDGQGNLYNETSKPFIAL